MGYTTDFYGEFQFSRPLTESERIYLKQFSKSRHIIRNVKKLPDYLVNDPVRLAVGLPYGKKGEYVVDPYQRNDPSIINFNKTPTNKRGYYCQWVPNEDGTCLEWDGGEKFYNYVEWLQYLMDNFLTPWNIGLNGKVVYKGEDSDDVGFIQCSFDSNKVKHVN